MASISLEVKGLNKALKEIEGDAKDFLNKANKKFKVAGVRMEAYAKADAPVKTGFHKRNIKHNPKAPFLTAEITAFADYASVLEFGFFGIVEVPAHQRRTASGVVDVDSHIRPMNRKARPHLVPGGKRALDKLIKDLDELR